MPLYVLALTDTALEKWTVGRRTLHCVNLGRLYAICERRPAAPPASDEELREQHALVADIASRVRAILPVRFGALIEKPALAALVRTHDAAIRRALDEVRDHVQMTIRIVGRRSSPVSVATLTGRQYLERKREAAVPLLPSAARALLAALGPLVMRERQEPGAGRLLATVYHLVGAGDVPRYTRIVKQRRNAAAIVTGPWPPFAFTPQLL